MQQKLVNEAQKKNLPTTSATNLQNNVCFVDRISVVLELHMQISCYKQKFYEFRLIFVNIFETRN